jgi:hypothetical protein
MRSPVRWSAASVWNCGVGVLTVNEKRERRGRNSSTGKALIIGPHRVVRFRVSELLLVRLNQTSRRPERPQSDPRQLAFRIDRDQETKANIETNPMLSRLPGWRADGKSRKREQFMKTATKPRGTIKPAQKKPARKKLATKPANPNKVWAGPDSPRSSAAGPERGKAF